MSDYAGHRAIVAGWGRTSEHGPASVVPKKGHVQIMKDEFCLESAISEHYADAMLCAYGGSIDACQVIIKTKTNFPESPTLKKNIDYVPVLFVTMFFCNVFRLCWFSCLILESRTSK